MLVEGRLIAGPTPHIKPGREGETKNEVKSALGKHLFKGAELFRFLPPQLLKTASRGNLSIAAGPEDMAVLTPVLYPA